MKELVYGGHFLALGTASLAASSAILLGRSPTFFLLLMAYLFSYGAYMLNRGSEFVQDNLSNPDRTNHLNSRRKFLTKIAVASFGAGYTIAFFVNLIFFVALLVPLALALVYSVGSRKLTGLIGAKRLKDKLLVKNLSISLGWSLIPILVGLYYQSLSFILFVMVPFIFFRLMSNTIFFDVRDVKADSEYGVRTVPVVYGKRFAYFITNVFDVVSALYLLTMVLITWFPPYTLVMCALPAYSVAYRLASLSPKAIIDFLCDVVADGEFLLWSPVLLVG